MSNDESFGRFVRERRRALDLTQEELARRVGCAAITLRKIEADDLRPSVQIAERLAMALAIPLDDRAGFVRRARAARPEPADAPAPTPAPALEEIGQEDLTGRAIRGYALAERIGAGGMGAVYRAIQPNVEREVAVKIILPAYANHPDFIRRFETEAQLVARLEHPHIVPLYDYWREPGVAYLVMRLLRGGNVQALMQNGPLPLETAYHLLEQICPALHAAHRIGVIHRDLKPANVLLDEDNNAYLADFGIAKNLGNPNLETHTQMDVVMGSPQYMSPEQIRSLSVKPQTDIYCLGVMLYEMLTGSLPFTGPTPFDLIQQHITAPMPPLAARRAGLPAALDEVIGRATAKDAQDRYHDVSSLLDDFRRALDGGLTARPVFMPSPDEEAETEPINPYKGLRAFNEADSEDFFGRESLIQQLLARLGEGGDLSRFLAVVGPSGSGKSSVVGAGLAPAIRQGGLPGSENWFVVDLVPGPHPFEELEAALLRVAINPPESLLAQLKDGDRGLLRAVNRILPSDESVELVLVIDQFEEVFTLVAGEEERALLLSSLVAAVLDERSRVRVILTLRADFTDRPLRYVDFGELVQRRSEFVMALTPDELERAILGPAKRAGLRLEAGLTSAMIREVGDQPGALPLLQYALTELFEKREGRALTKKAYAEIGGALGALGRRAEEVFTSLDEAGQSAARQLFLRLVTLGEGVEDTRRRVLRSELEALATPISNLQFLISIVIESFGKHRLLTFDRDPLTRGSTVEVAHEALLREWPRLREWLNESRADVRLQRQLAHAAHEWQNANRDVSFLLMGARLEQFEGWAASTSMALTQDEGTFLEASIAERQKREAEETARQQRELEAARKLAETEREAATRLRARNRVIAIAGGIALLLAVLAGIFGLQSNQNAKQATSRELASAALANLDVDPELSILLALKSIDVSQSANTTPVVEAQDALHQAIRLSRLEFSLAGHSADVTGIAFSPDGRWLATSSADGAARLWDVQSHEEIAVLAGHEGAVNDLAFSPDGKVLATVGDDMTLRLWDLATKQAHVIPTGHTLWVVSVAFNADGTRLVTSSRDDSVQVWDVATEEALLTFTCGDNDDINDAAFSPDGLLVAMAHESAGVTMWSATSGKPQLTVLRDGFGSGGLRVLSTAFSPDSRRLLSAHQVGMAKLWNMGTGRVIQTIYHTGSVFDVTFNPKGTRFATTSQDGTIKIWDTASGHELLTLYGSESGVAAAAFSPDDKYLASVNGAEVKVWNVSPTGTQEWLDIDGHTGEVTGLAYSPDGKRMVTTGSDGQLAVWDAETGSNVFVDRLRRSTRGAAMSLQGASLSPDGKSLAVIGDDATVRVWDLETRKEVRLLSGHADLVTIVAYSPDGTHLATGSYDGTARVWDAATGETIFALNRDATNPVNAVAYDPSDHYLATGNRNGVVAIWEASTGQLLKDWKGHMGAVSGVAFSPDGKYLATAGYDGVVKIWDGSTFALLSTLTGHRGAIRDLAFSPDSMSLATASSDGTAKVWSLANSESLTLYAPRQGVTGVAFSPDSKRLATIGQDGSVRVYALDLSDLLTIAKMRLTRVLSSEECQKFLHGPCP
jgi:WD40 repeat protein/serine/threonine protein kinase/DNA-binding XRE family transcriptional regulator